LAEIASPWDDLWTALIPVVSRHKSFDTGPNGRQFLCLCGTAAGWAFCFHASYQIPFSCSFSMIWLVYYHILAKAGRCCYWGGWKTAKLTNFWRHNIPSPWFECWWHLARTCIGKYAEILLGPMFVSEEQILAQLKVASIAKWSGSTNPQ
jgi:hypothetical protein